jgi:hypothetical protein
MNEKKTPLSLNQLAASGIVVVVSIHHDLKKLGKNVTKKISNLLFFGVLSTLDL